MNNHNMNYKYMQVNSKDILTDFSYQRAVDFARVKNIVTYFNPNLVNPIKVSSRDGKFYVFDGQHTLAALKARNGNRHLYVECKVYTGLTKVDEARLFSEQNGMSRVVKTNAKMKALYTAGDIEIIELCNAINSLGIVFNFTESKGANKLIACSTIYKIFKNTSSTDFKEILEIIRDAWGGDSESFNKEMLNGMYIFYTAYKGQLSKQKAIRQFGKVSPQMIIREGKDFREGGDSRFARQLLIAYNKKLRSGRLVEEF